MAIKEEDRELLSKMRADNDHNADRLAELLHRNKWNNYYEQRKQLFQQTNSKDPDAFLARIEGISARKTADLEQRREKQKQTLAEMARPTLSPLTIELTKNRKPFVKRIDEMIEKSKSAAKLRNPNAPKPDQEVTPSKKKIDDFKEMELRAKANVFYKRNVEWEKKKEEEQFERRVKEGLQKEPQYSFTPRLNKKKNSELIGKDFEERLKATEEKKQMKKKEVEAEMYEFSFKPRMFKK